MIKHICFDFDGVILDSLQLHLDTIREAFGLQFTRSEYSGFLDGNFTDSKIGKLDWDKYHIYLAPKYATQKFTSDVIGGLHSLSKTYQLSINSTGGDGMLRAICDANNVSDLFCEIWGAHTAPYKTTKFAMLMDQYNLQAQEILFITDTLGDINEAHEMNIKTIAMTGGYHEREKLESGKPFAIVDSWDQLQKTIDSLKEE